MRLQGKEKGRISTVGQIQENLPPEEGVPARQARRTAVRPGELPATRQSERLRRNGRRKVVVRAALRVPAR
jgi:hypothetical protein